MDHASGVGLMDASLSAGHRHGQLHRQSLNSLLGVGKVKALVEPGPDEGQENPVDGRGGNGNGLGGLDRPNPSVVMKVS